MFRPKQKCYYCENKKLPDYKEPEILKKFLSDRSKIQAASRTGICAKHQRRLTRAIKQARHLALVPFVS